MRVEGSACPLEMRIPRNNVATRLFLWLCASCLIHLLLGKTIDGRLLTSDVQAHLPRLTFSARILPLKQAQQVSESVTLRHEVSESLPASESELVPPIPDAVAAPIDVPVTTKRVKRVAVSSVAEKDSEPEQHPRFERKDGSEGTLNRLLRTQREVVAAVPREVSTGIFNPRFRKALEAARREQKRRQAMDGRMDDPYMKELYRAGGYATVRIGESCWKVPQYEDPQDHVTRIWMRDFDCPKPHKKIFLETAGDRFE